MRKTSTIGVVLAVLNGSLLLAGCQSPDVGQACTLRTSLDVATLQADFLESGNTACDSLVCIASPPQPAGSAVKNNPYCSKPCVSNDDCYQGDTGLICRPVTVDPTYLVTLPPATQCQYLALLNCPSLPSNVVADCGQVPPVIPPGDEESIASALRACALSSSYCATPVQ